MQEVCTNLASTGSQLMLFVWAAFGLIFFAVILYILVVRKFSFRNFAALLLALSLFGSLVFYPSSIYAQSLDPNCDPETSQNGSADPNDGDDEDEEEPVTIVCPDNWIVVPGNSNYGTTDFCVMKYLAKEVGGVATSQAGIAPWVSISQTDAAIAAQDAAPGAHLITEDEWMTLAHNILMTPANWCDSDGTNCGNTPGTTGKIFSGGHSDSAPNQVLVDSTDDNEACFGTVVAGTNSVCGSVPGTQKRTLALSNGEVIWDLAGNAWEWTAGTAAQGDLPSLANAGGLFEFNEDVGTIANAPDNWGTLAYLNPAVQNPSSIAWGVPQNLGIMYTDYALGSSTIFGFIRGGSYDEPGSRVFTIALENLPSATWSGIGFRAAL